MARERNPIAVFRRILDRLLGQSGATGTKPVQYRSIYQPSCQFVSADPSHPGLCRISKDQVHSLRLMVTWRNQASSGVVNETLTSEPSLLTKNIRIHFNTYTLSSKASFQILVQICQKGKKPKHHKRVAHFSKFTNNCFYLKITC